jgi:2-dehydro-3-deoxyphosphogluconate aldolase / (4S)-4-hydroxy-2-oxoglutarate aldolase
MSALTGADHTATEAEAAVVDRFRQLRIIPVATVAAEHAAKLGRLLVGAGLPCLEVTFRSADAAAAIEEARSVEGLLVGAGTVVSPEHAEAAAEAGADFAVAPATNGAVLSRCRELGLPFFPGVATPSEIDRARAAGFRTLKLFPAAPLGGPAYLRAVSAVYPDVGFIPTGGVSPENLAEYLELPCVVACGGSWLVAADHVRSGRLDVVDGLVREAVRLAA